MSQSSQKAENNTGYPVHIREEEAYLSIVRTYNRLNSEFSRFSRRFGVTLVQYNILRILRGAGTKGLSGKEIRNRLATQEPDMTRLIDRLQKLAFVKRSPSSDDRRIVYVRITEQGTDLLKKMDTPSLDVLRKFMGHMNNSELQTITELMLKARHQPAETVMI